MSIRARCLVPFCNHTRGDRKNSPVHEGMEWICGQHWRAVPRILRHQLSLAYRAYKRRFGANGYWAYPPGSPERLEAVRLDREYLRAWGTCKAAACEAAGGIA